MKDSRKFYDPTLGEVSLAQLYAWIRKTAKHVDALFFDPIFDMLGIGQKAEIRWVTREGLHCMKTVERVA